MRQLFLRFFGRVLPNLIFLVSIANRMTVKSSRTIQEHSHGGQDENRRKIGFPRISN